MKLIHFFLILALALTGCAKTAATDTQIAPTVTNTPIPPATANPTATLTDTPTPTITSTPTPPPTDTPTPTPQPTCTIPDGKWESEHYAGEAPGGYITFETRDCKIVTIMITAFPVQSELDWISEEDISIPIEDNQWSYTWESGEGQLTLDGTFDSESSSSGTLKYTQGYFIVDYTLSEDVEIPWTAMYVSSPYPVAFSNGDVALEIPGYWRQIDTQGIPPPEGQEYVIALSPPEGESFFKISKWDAAEQSRDEFADSLDRVIKSHSDSKLISKDEISIGGEKAIRFIYTLACPGKPDQTCKSLSTITQRDQTSYLISYLDDLDPFDQYWPDVEKILMSIQFSQ